MYAQMDGWMDRYMNRLIKVLILFLIDRMFHTKREFSMEYKAKSSPSMESSNPTLTSQYEHINSKEMDKGGATFCTLTPYLMPLHLHQPHTEGDVGIAEALR